MTQGPTFEKVCALYLYGRAKGIRPESMTVVFEDTASCRGDPGLPDIDVRTHYPEGSSAFEQVLLALGSESVERFAELAGILNENNATGFLKRGEYGTGSLVELIRRAYDLRDPRACTAVAWRRKMIRKFLRVAETAILFYGFARELDTERARDGFRLLFPRYKAGPLTPFTLNGYAYARWILDPTGFAKSFATEAAWWRKMMATVESQVRRRATELKAAELKAYQSPKHGTRVLYLEAETDVDAKAAFKAYPKVDILVVIDRRTGVPRTAILPRIGRPVVRQMHAIHVALAKREPEAWYSKERPNGASMLLNGSTSRAPKIPSVLAAAEAPLMGALLVAIEDMYVRPPRP